MLTQAFLKEFLNYDQETGIFTWRKFRGGMVPGSIAGSIRPDGYIKMKLSGTFYGAHRLAWLYVHGTMPNGCIDHIDHNTSNNSIKNLRDVTHMENQQNQINAPAHSKSGLLGASFSKSRNKFVAKIRKNNIVHHIGYFDTAEQAHAAYVLMKRELHSTCTI